ncbi:MAG: copper amine oxidase N-terminal domain-containing protein, partial [Caldisericia bacterium]|nr:copper amine oxidase N-terminal domain-containing protein [Caldisericia bacterium]
LTINNKTADVNGRKVQLDVAPIIVKGRTFVPVRFVSENLGASVEWIAEEEKIIVKYPKI